MGYILILITGMILYIIIKILGEWKTFFLGCIIIFGYLGLNSKPSNKKIEKSRNDYEQVDNNRTYNSDNYSYKIKNNTYDKNKSQRKYKQYSNYKYKKINRIRVGAICNDGTTSKATGRGACSHHGGVKEWIYE